jgi:hypothetical protein
VTLAARTSGAACLAFENNAPSPDLAGSNGATRGALTTGKALRLRDPVSRCRRNYRRLMSRGGR